VDLVVNHLHRRQPAGPEAVARQPPAWAARGEFPILATGDSSGSD
jgi:hypothetical protein